MDGFTRMLSSESLLMQPGRPCLLAGFALWRGPAGGPGSPGQEEPTASTRPTQVDNDETPEELRNYCLLLRCDNGGSLLCSF